METSQQYKFSQRQQSSLKAEMKMLNCSLLQETRDLFYDQSVAQGTPVLDTKTHLTEQSSSQGWVTTSTHTHRADTAGTRVPCTA